MMNVKQMAVLNEAFNRIELIHGRSLTVEESALFGWPLLDGEGLITWHCARCGEFHTQPYRAKK